MSKRTEELEQEAEIEMVNTTSVKYKGMLYAPGQLKMPEDAASQGIAHCFGIDGSAIPKSIVNQLKVQEAADASAASVFATANAKKAAK